MTLNPANSLQAPAAPMPADRQANSAPAEVPFNQVLSGEIASRSNATDAGQDASGEPDSGARAEQQVAGVVSDPSYPEAKADETTDAARADIAANPSASAELLALVANIHQATTKPAVPDTAAVSTGGAPVAVDTGHASGGLEARAGVRELPGNALAAGANGKEATTRPDAGFASVINQAKQPSPMSERTAFEAGAARTQEALPGSVPATALPLQQAALTVAQAVAGQPAEKLTPRVGTAAWDQALGQKVVWMAAGAQQSASLTLNPPDLGPLQVVLNVTNDQASATFIAAQPEVRQALEAALPKLREMMGDAGIQLGEATVSAGTPNQHGAADGSPRRASPDSGASGAASSDSVIHAGHTQMQARGQGLVDTFA